MNDTAEVSATSTVAHLGIDSGALDATLSRVAGSLSNVQDVYPLLPVQEGMLFHSLLNESTDGYVLSVLFELPPDTSREALASALQCVVDRHDALRTAIVWDGVPRPMQVVCRRAQLQVEELLPHPTQDACARLRALTRPCGKPLDLQRAPLARVQFAAGVEGAPSFALLRVHHLICDHASLSTLIAELASLLAGNAELTGDVVPYRDFVLRSLDEADAPQARAYFQQRLGSLGESTAPFGLLNTREDGARLEETCERLSPDVESLVRRSAQHCGVTVARIVHAAWALVVSKTSGSGEAVFGSVISPRRERDSLSPSIGLRINTLPLRLRVSGMTVTALIASVDRELAELRAVQPTALAVAQSCSGVGAAAPLFTSLMNYRRTGHIPQPDTPDIAPLVVLTRGEAWTNYPLTIIVDDLPDELRITTQVDRAITSKRVAGCLRAALEGLAHALLSAPRTLASAICVLPGEQRRELLENFNDTRVSYPQPRLIHGLFEAQAVRTPGAAAVRCCEEMLSYDGLNRRANQLARYLRGIGVRRGDFVGICLDRGADLVVSVLAVLKAGGAYVPLDPEYPEARRQFVLTDTTPAAIVCHARYKSALSAAKNVVALEECAKQIALQPDADLSSDHGGVTDADLAYVIYTSGSTGRPKGVAIDHRAAVNLIRWGAAALEPCAFGETLFSTSLNFDLSVYECFVPLSVGGTVRVARNALALLDDPHSVTLINTVPSAARAILEAGEIPRSVHIMNLAGEPLREDLVQRIFQRSDVQSVCNLYGPSETTTYSTSVAMSRATGFNSSIGRPVANTQIHILDRHLQLLPVGVTGELYIGGVGVARGYVNRPDQTAERFLADPFASSPGARMYRTGDLGRWRADGTIEYLGRNDSQVKIRGFRIEIGEIEARLLRSASVREAAVSVREDARGDRSLVAYVSGDHLDGAGLSPLRADLQRALPGYMIPSAFVILDRLPLTPNGKLDRAALPAPGPDAYAGTQYVPPEGEVEEALAEVWRTLLGIGRVGRCDNFIELGGHSLLATRMVSRLRELFHVALPLSAVFDAPTVEQLAQLISAEQERCTAEGSDQLERLSRDLKAEIEGLSDQAVMERIARLEKQRDSRGRLRLQRT